MSREATGAVLARYPITVHLKGQDYRIRAMNENDGPALMAFAQSLPPHDTLYMRRDITRPAGVETWIKALSQGIIYSLLAEDDHGVSGYSTVNLNDLEWTRHVADLRVATAERARGNGLGRVLVREAFNIALALGIEKLFARMTPDQQGARVLFQELGFLPEALLKDHVKDRDGKYHDLLLEACRVPTFLAQRAAYGRDRSRTRAPHGAPAHCEPTSVMRAARGELRFRAISAGTANSRASSYTEYR